MNLTQIQQELRLIEERISLLNSNIEKIKPKTEEDKKTDFEKITKIAKKHPIKNTTIKSITDFEKKKFVNSLAYLILADDEDIYSRLLYLNRFSFGIGLEFSAEDIYKNGLEFEMEDIDDLCVQFQEYKYTYLVEAFIIANISKNASLKMITLIADIAKAIGMDKEQLRVISTVAKAKLQDDLDVLSSLSLNSNIFSNCFTDYISKEWIVSKRELCGLLCIEKYYERTDNWYKPWEFDNRYFTSRISTVKEKVQDGKMVKKGDIIITYEENDVKKQIEAPSNGVVYFVDEYKKGSYEKKKDKYLAAYIISYFDNYKDFLNWHSNKK